MAIVSKMTSASFEDLKEKGNDAFRSKNYVKAIAHYTEAIQVKQDEPVAYSNRAMCYLLLERYYEALEDCDKAIKYDSNHVKSYYRRATALSKLSRFQRARKDFMKVLELDPSNTNAKKEADQIDKIIDSDTRVDLKAYPKPIHIQSDKSLRDIELLNRYSGTFLYDELNK